MQATGKDPGTERQRLQSHRHGGERKRLREKEIKKKRGRKSER